MEAHARAPDPLSAYGDMASNWESWKEDFIIFMKITGYMDRPNVDRANFLKNQIGKIGIDAIKNMEFDQPEDKDDMDILIAKLEEYFNPPKKEIVERYQFFTTYKNPKATIEEHINHLKEKAKSCNFNDMTESIIRDKVVLDTKDAILRKILFEADNLDLQKLIAIYNDYDMNIQKMKQVSQQQVSQQQISMENKTQQANPPPQCFNNIRPTCINNTTHVTYVNKRPPCWRCGRNHPPKQCPAWGSKCTKCGDVNHFTHCCKGFKPVAATVATAAIKGNDNKVNKNVFNATHQPKFPKPKDGWNNRANFNATTSKSMPSLPDVPTDPVTSGSSFSDRTFYDRTIRFLEQDTCRAHIVNSNSNLNCKTIIKQTPAYQPAYSKNSAPPVQTTSTSSCAKKSGPESVIYTSINTNTARVPVLITSAPKSISTCKPARHFPHAIKKNEDKCVLL